MRIDESLINAHILSSSKVFANHTSIGRLKDYIRYLTSSVERTS